MAHMPSDDKEFALAVRDAIRRLYPEKVVHLEAHFSIIVDGRRISLDNLRRLVNRDQERGTEIVQHYLEHLLSSESIIFSQSNFSLVQPKLMPRIQPVSIFRDLSPEMVAHVPFVNDTVVVFVIDMPNMTISVTTAQMVHWGVSVDDIEVIARKNLERYASGLSAQVVESKEGGKAAIFAEQDGYDAARLLLPTLHRLLRDQLDGDFHVYVPARDMFVAASIAPEQFAKRIKTRVVQEHKRLPYPVTDVPFLVTRDGVAGTL